MSEKFKPQEQPPKTEPREGEDILFFEKLDEESKKFVLEVKQLSEMPEEEFLAKLPVNLRQGLKESLEDDKKGPIEHVAKMWELVTFYLSLLDDFQKLGREMYSRRTEHLTKKILERISNRNIRLGLPLQFREDCLKKQFPHFLAAGVLPEDPKWKVRLLDNIISAYHTSIRMPGLLGLVEDLWRYVYKDFKDLSNEEKQAREEEFFAKLGNLRAEIFEQTDK